MTQNVAALITNIINQTKYHGRTTCMIFAPLLSSIRAEVELRLKSNICKFVYPFLYVYTARNEHLKAMFILFSFSWEHVRFSELSSSTNKSWLGSGPIHQIYSVIPTNYLRRKKQRIIVIAIMLEVWKISLFVVMTGGLLDTLKFY